MVMDRRHAVQAAVNFRREMLKKENSLVYLTKWSGIIKVSWESLQNHDERHWQHPSPPNTHKTKKKAVFKKNK